jgi:hypothetical protein
VANLAERLGEVVGGIAVVFDDEKPHDDPVDPIDLAAAATRAGTTPPWR